VHQNVDKCSILEQAVVFLLGYCGGGDEAVKRMKLQSQEAEEMEKLFNELAARAETQSNAGGGGGELKSQDSLAGANRELNRELDRVMRENDDLRGEVEDLRVEVALLNAGINSDTFESIRFS
jgi:hypothetical protein